jgi:nicotinamidase-related amidase
MRINRDESLLVVVDIQEKLFPHINNNQEMLKKCRTLIRGCQELGLRTLVTEQYRKGLGSSIEEISELWDSFESIEKMRFSCCGSAEFMLKIEEHYTRNIILCGIESHVCVLQTAIDSQAAGHQAIVVADASSSRFATDKDLAIERMKQEGVRIASTESILFELCKDSGSPEFKAISKLVK